ncbi:MAG TPA: 30S ribosomal protein S1 [Terriglobales bacterium]
MSDTNNPESPTPTEPNESFDQLLSEYELSHARLREDGGKQLEGTVVAVTADSVLLDIGYKSEGILPLAELQSKGEEVKPGDKMLVSVKGRDPDGYYELSRTKISRPKDWAALERAFTEKATIVGTVTGVVKGGLSVDVGVRAFMPASRSGTRDAAELEKMVGQEIRCRITKLDVTDEDVVVDRRALAEEEERAGKERRYAEVKEGDVVNGTVRSLTDYGAFVDLGGVDGLLHISDIAWSRVNKPEDVLTVGQEIEAKVLKVDTERQRISLGMKQLLPHPWDAVPDKYKTGDRVRGAVSRIADFGAFVELEPGVEGLVHISEMSWAKKVRTPSDLVKPGEVVEAVILGINLTERRIALGIKQTLGDPWANASQKFAVGSAIEGTVTSLPKFGAFVQLSEGVEGMVHISEISAEKRINHPQEVLKVGQTVKAQIIALDTEKRLIRLSMKQLVPTSLDEYLAEHKAGDLVTGRLTEVAGGVARVELGEGVNATCPIPSEETPALGASSNSKADVSALGSMLMSRWKGSTSGPAAKPEAARTGQIRSFRITKLEPEAKKIELELA